MSSKQEPTAAERLLRECLIAINGVPGFTYTRSKLPMRSYDLAARIEIHLRDAGFDPYKLSL